MLSQVLVIAWATLRAFLSLPILTVVITFLVAAAWTTGSRLRRASGMLLALTALSSGWFMASEYPLARAASVLITVVGSMRVADLLRGEWSLRARIAHVVSVVDTRRLTRGPRRVHAKSLAVGLAWFAVQITACVLLVVVTRPAGVALWVHRWVCGVVLVYAGVSAGYALARVQYGTLGFETGVLHAAPILARTVQEFWGERWARPISVWCRETCLKPLARRRHPVAGAFLAFFFSAAFHAYAVWVALGLVKGLAMAGAMLLFFIAQAVVIVMERALRVRRWAPWLAHVWTVTWMLGTAPLFVEPAVRVLLAAGP